MKRFGRSAAYAARLRPGSSLRRCPTTAATPPARPSRPALQPFSVIENRAKQVGCRGQIFQRQRKERLLGGFMAPRQPGYRFVIEAAMGNGVFEDRRVRRQPGHRPLGDVARKSAAHQHFAADVVDPKALAHVVQFLRVGVHGFSWCMQAGPVRAAMFIAGFPPTSRHGHRMRGAWPKAPDWRRPPHRAKRSARARRR